MLIYYGNTQTYNKTFSLQYSTPSQCVIWNVHLLVICLQYDEQYAEEDDDADDDDCNHGAWTWKRKKGLLEITAYYFCEFMNIG